MGTIRTKGKASREIEYDKMTITMTFNTRERRSKDAIRKVVEECENFLEELKSLGVDITKIRGGNNKVSYNNYGDNKDTEAARTITWNADYDITMIDAVMRLSENASYNVDININPIYSKKIEVYKELMKEATLDAKRTADILAESLGTTIKGPSKINASGDYDYMADEEYIENDSAGVVYGITLKGSYGGGSYSDLRNPTSLLDKEITIEWELNE